MSSNVGLSTPRGSGTSGYVQRNLSLLKPRATGIGAPYTSSSAPRPRKPDQSILHHDRLRDIEISVLELRDRLEDEGVDEDEIDGRCDQLRDKLVGEMERGKAGNKKVIKGYQVHEAAEAKAVESERLRKALGLGGSRNGRGKEGVEEGDEDEHPMARQERRRREKEAERVRVELEMEEREQDREREREGDRDRRGRS